MFSFSRWREKVFSFSRIPWLCFYLHDALVFLLQRRSNTINAMEYNVINSTTLPNINNNNEGTLIDNNRLRIGIKRKMGNEETKPPAKSQLERVWVLPPTNKKERTHKERDAQIKTKARTRAYVFFGRIHPWYGKRERKPNKVRQKGAMECRHPWKMEDKRETSFGNLWCKRQKKQRWQRQRRKQRRK